jgi:hypothetical protein
VVELRGNIAREVAAKIFYKSLVIDSCVRKNRFLKCCAVNVAENDCGHKIFPQ